MMNKIFTWAMPALVAVVVLLPAGHAEAAGPFMRGPMIGHVSPTSAVIWANKSCKAGRCARPVPRLVRPLERHPAGRAGFRFYEEVARE